MKTQADKKSENIYFGEDWEIDTRGGGECHIVGRDAVIADFSPRAGGPMKTEDCKARAKRAIECVNACKGIPEPQKLRELHDYCQDFFTRRAPEEFGEAMDDFLAFFDKINEIVKQNDYRCRFYDEDNHPFVTNDEKEIQFIEDMEKAGIPWRTYSGRGMFGRECPAAVTSDEISEQDVYRATDVPLSRDNMGLYWVLYTG